MSATSDMNRLVQRVEKLEERVKFLEGSEEYMKAVKEKRRQSRCRWIQDKSCPGGKFWLPVCWGGLMNGKSGCYCPR